MMRLTDAYKSALCITAVALMLGCSSEQGASPVPQAATSDGPVQTHQNAGIQWFAGSVDEALAQSRDQGRPVFLFWGAVWCPPCNLIKSTVFTDPEFIQQTRDFIAVYLDGDQDDAQRWGEHFSAMGYPTLIVLSPDGQELMRLSSGQQAEAYRLALKQVQATTIGISSLFETALTAPESLDQTAWTRLAQYGWELDQGQLLQQRPAAEVFEQFARVSPGSELPIRFALLAQLARLDAQQAPTDGAAAVLEKMLRSEGLLRAHLPELQYRGAELLLALPMSNPAEREPIIALYREAMEAVWADDSLPLKLRFNAHQGLLQLALAGAIDKAAFVPLLQQRVSWLVEQPMSPQQAQSMIPGAAWMLHLVGQSAQARDLLKSYLETAITPYYSMSYLAALEEDLENIDAALAWSAKAWQLADGPATRIQWGLSYLNRLLLLAPDQSEQIVSVLSDVVAQLKAHPGSFYQRTRVRLERSLVHLKAWAQWPEHRQHLAALTPELQALCGGLAEGHPSAAICSQYLNLSRAKET